MKSRLIDAAAFAIGLIPAYLAAGRVDEFPWMLRLVFTVLSPGYFVGIPFVQIIGMIGLFSFGFFFFVAIVVNGLIYGLVSYLARNALKGRRAARLVLGLGMGIWITWGAVYTVQAWPWPERFAPVVLASPLTGRWEGVFHGMRGDRHVTLVCHPRADSTLDGYLYIHGHDLGSFDEATYAGDSIFISIIGTEYRARFEGSRMNMTASSGGHSQAAELQFVSADTTRPGRAPIDHETPLFGRWDGVYHGPAGRDHPITLVFQPRTDGTLQLYFYSSGNENQGVWNESWSADSVQFRLGRIPYRARFDDTAMALEWVIEGNTRSMELSRASSDTTRLYRPKPNQWIGVGGGP